MTDLELTRLCAEAMGLSVELETRSGAHRWRDEYNHTYAPLQDDAQAMALVKKFRLQIDPHSEQWNVASLTGYASLTENLNRAICECVAKMQSQGVPS